jgi:putative tryptophan/tyrosine transport system substrate-binding protein
VTRATGVLMLALWLLAALATPSIVDAQTPSRVPKVVVLAPGLEQGPTTVPAREAFQKGLTDRGWTPGKNIRVDFRYAEGGADRLAALAREVVRDAPDVIVARATAAIRAAKAATSTIPIVMSASGFDPVVLGLVESLGKPGGNITGLTLMNQELPAKQLQLLKEIVPQLSRVAILGSGANPMPASAQDAIETAARTLGIQLQEARPRTAEELDQAFVNFARWKAGGLLVVADPFVLEANVGRVIGLAHKHKLPAVYWLHVYPEAGGLMSYGADLFDILYRSASYVDRILRGARPADLPVEEPTKFTLVVNRKAAHTLGLTMPPSIMARVNVVIE